MSVNITLNAPTGVSSAIGSDGNRYAVVAGVVTLPQSAAQPLYAAGFYIASATGSAGATGATGSTGATGATGP